jgi:hypothetical protein
MTSSTQRDWIATYDPDDSELRAAIHRRYSRFRLVFLPAFVVGYIVTSIALEAAPGGDTDPPVFSPPAWLVGVMGVVAAVLIVAGVAIALRPAVRSAIRRNPRALLTPEQNRRVYSQIGGRVAVAPHEVPFLRDVALGTYAQRWVAAALAGAMLLAVSYAIRSDTDDALLASVLVLMTAVSGTFALRSAVHARRFLRSHGVTPV